MAAYPIGQVVVRDPKKFAPYVGKTSAIIAHDGGEALTREPRPRPDAAVRSAARAAERGGLRRAGRHFSR